MKTWIVEQDEVVTETRKYAVRADTLEDAIEMVDEGTEDNVVYLCTNTWYDGGGDISVSYKDSREATPGEVREYFENQD